ncbi:MAG: nucleotidyltransferase family protein [Bacteroidetes bacterium]|nr:nucleotidyltransferase family protein [Bacteroidota bacterium]
MECIVLAGGLGTRLRGAIGENVPKCMAPVNGRPFLHYLFDYLSSQPCERVILSLGHKYEAILEWLQTEQRPFLVDHVIEQEPLGTGGGIQLALEAAKGENVAVLNGDTMFKVNLKEQLNLHSSQEAETTLALKEMHNFDRYGVVNFDTDDFINSFEEKQQRDNGYINGGVYIVNRNSFLARQLPEKFSFEKDYLEAFVNEQKFCAYKSDAYFIDIGIPQDYEQAQQDFKSLFR